MTKKTRGPAVRRPEESLDPEDVVERVDLPQPRNKGPRPKGSEAQENPRQDTLPRAPRKKKGGPSIS